MYTNAKKIEMTFIDHEPQNLQNFEDTVLLYAKFLPPTKYIRIFLLLQKITSPLKFKLILFFLLLFFEQKPSVIMNIEPTIN